MKKLLVLLVLFAVSGTAFFLHFRARNGASPGEVRLSGNVEVTETEVSFRIPGRVVKRYVSEGEQVQLGEKVARLDTTDLEQEIALRRAQLRAAEAALAELTAGSRPEEVAQAEAEARGARARLGELLVGSRPQEVAAAGAAVEGARAETDRWKAERDRQEALFRRDVISAREYEAAQSAYETARSRFREAEERLALIREGPRREVIDQARAALSQAEEKLALVRKGPRSETIEQARAVVEQERSALALAETRLDYAEIASPLAGVVLSQSVEAGEYVTAGTPVVTVGDLMNAWLRAYVEETDLGRIHLGQKVRVTADTYPEKVYEGRVSFISSQAEFTPKAVQTRKERVKLVYRVKVDVRNPNQELKPGMPADGILEEQAAGNRQ